VERSSKADMQRDWQKSTACCVSHIKHRKARLTWINEGRMHLDRDYLPLLLLCIYPCMPIIFQIIRSIFRRGWPDCLTVAAPYQVDEKAMEEMRHVVLLLTRPALAKALNKEDGLQYPQVRLGRESCVGENLGPQDIVYAYLEESKEALM
jgi:hypothetical protein